MASLVAAFHSVDAPPVLCRWRGHRCQSQLPLPDTSLWASYPVLQWFYEIKKKTKYLYLWTIPHEQVQHDSTMIPQTRRYSWDTVILGFFLAGSSFMGMIVCSFSRWQLYIFSFSKGLSLSAHVTSCIARVICPLQFICAITVNIISQQLTETLLTFEPHRAVKCH